MANSETAAERKAMFKRNPIEVKLNEEILELLELMGQEKDKGTDKYAKMNEQLTKLYDLRHKGRISKEALANISVNVAGIVAILSYERAHVIASKAFGLVKKIV